jgi:GDP-4-dehydro-6-deoxy-D-mannose reductase
VPHLRILITGGSGFVGRRLIKALCSRPEQPEIIVGIHRAATFQHHSVRCTQIDVSDAAQVRSVIAAERPTHLFHLAGISHVANADIRRTWDVNFGGSLNVAIAVKELAPSCRLLCCTSAEIYGDSFRLGEPIDEDADLDPINAYGASKAASDFLIGQMAKQGLKAIRLRPFNHIGPGQSEAFVVPSFAAQIARIESGHKPPVLRVGRLTMRRDFLDVRDVVDAYVRAILRFDQLPAGCALNIASGKSVAVEDILKILVSLSESEIEVIVDPERLRRHECPVTVGNANRARTLLDWAPRFELFETLRLVLDWHRSRSVEGLKGDVAATGCL